MNFVDKINFILEKITYIVHSTLLLIISKKIFFDVNTQFTRQYSNRTSMVTTPRENKFCVATDQKLSLQIPMNHTQVHWNSYIILRNMNTILRNVMSMTLYLTIPFLSPSLLKNHFIYNHIVEMKKNSYWCHTFSFLSPIYNNLCCPFLTNKWALSLLGYFICACKTLNVGRD